MRPRSITIAFTFALLGCFNPDDPPAATETATDGGSSGSSTGVNPASSGESGDGTSGDTGDTACSDACDLDAAPQCEGDMLLRCVEGPQGCSMVEPSTCAMGCEVGACVGMVCGDGNLQEPEACDDGNADDGDGCSARCGVEDGFTCSGPNNGDCTAPDLAIRILSATFTNRGLQVTYHVLNTGGAASGAYRVDLWDTRAGGLGNPPELGDVGAITLSDKPSLAPGATDLFTDTIPTPANGTHVAFAVVDTMDELVELDENDNVALGSAWTNAGSVVHASFTSTQTPTPIPGDGTPGMAQATVAAPAGAVPELFFSINISHPAAQELTARVFDENGASMVLFTELAAGPNLRSTSFRAGGEQLESASPPYAGLFDFEAEWDQPPVATGVWTLEVVDVGGEATGQINAFSVHTFVP